MFLAANRQREPLEQLYDRFWAPFDHLSVILGEKKPFWKEDIKQGRFKRTRLDLFVFHYTNLMVAHEMRIDHLFIEFRSWWKVTTRRRRRCARYLLSSPDSPGMRDISDCCSCRTQRRAWDSSPDDSRPSTPPPSTRLLSLFLIVAKTSASTSSVPS
jgi:hypothetical protein